MILTGLSYQSRSNQLIGRPSLRKHENGGIMKILIIGGKGTIGKKVSAHFSRKHEILIGGRNSGDVSVDIADSCLHCWRGKMGCL